MIHAVKISPKYFKDIEKGFKTFEVRKNDRPYCTDDYIALNEWKEEERMYTGRSLLCKITYILSDPQYCKDEYVIMAIERQTINKI